MSVKNCTEVVKRSRQWDQFWGSIADKVSLFTAEKEFIEFEKKLDVVWKKLYPSQAVPVQFYANIIDLTAPEGRVEIIRYVYGKHRNLLNSSVELLTGYAGSPLHQLRLNMPESIEALLELGANPNLICKGAKGATVLKHAIVTYPLFSTDEGRRKCAESIKILLKYKAIASPRLNEKGRRLLKWAKAELVVDRWVIGSYINAAINGVFPRCVLDQVTEYI